MSGRGPAWTPGHSRLVRRSRWRLAVVGALAVTVLLGVLSAAAYVLARQEIYGRLQGRLESAATHDADDIHPLLVDERGQVLPGTVPAEPAGTSAFRIMSDAELGALAVLRLPTAGDGSRLVATPAADSLQALREFLWLLVGLTLAGGLAALPTGYVFAGRALRPLEAAVRERSEFVARASHQLRTPLSIIRTSADLALTGRGLLPAEALQTVLDQTERMEALASRLNDLAYAEARPAAPRSAVDMADVVADVVRAVGPAADQRGVEIDASAAAGPAWVRAAADEAGDLLAAVVENAVKFSPMGGRVTVGIRADRGSQIVEVADQGPGIPSGELASVTEPFFQGRVAKGGHGLGLAIARAIAERRGGQLKIVSTPGEGTAVRIVLPAAKAP